MFFRLKVLLIFFLAVVLIQFLLKLNLTPLFASLGDSGFYLLFILLPVVFITLFETCGWYLTLKTKNEKINFQQLFLLRTAIDSLQNSIPGGFVIAELIRPVMLKKNTGLPINKGVASGIITKLNIAIAQLLFIVTGVAIMFVFYRKESAYLKTSGYESIFIGLVFSVLIIFGLSLFLYKYDGLIKIHDLMKRIKINFLNKFLLRNEEKIYEINTYIKNFNSQNSKYFIYTILVFYMGWMMIAVETLLIFRIIGVDLNFSQAIILESAVSLVRMAFFFLPSGVGAQDAGYVGLISSMGFADPVSSTMLFIFYKRTKEIIWIILGYIILFRFGLNPLRLYIKKFRKQLIGRKAELLFRENISAVTRGDR